MSDPLDDAMISYLVGDIEDAALSELDRRLRTDPAAARRFAQLCDHEVVLASMLRMRHGRQTPAHSRIIPRKVPRKLAARAWTFAAAAVALITIGFIWTRMQSTQLETPRVAEIAELVGTAEVQRAVGKSTLAVKASLRAGDRILVAQSSRLTISYADGTKLALDADTTLELPTRADKPIELRQGAVVASVAHQPAGKPLRLHTPQAQAEIVGTQFRLAIHGAATQLDVSEGQVRLTREKDQSTVRVDAGFSAVASAGAEVPMVLRRLQTLADGLPSGAQIIFRALAAEPASGPGWIGWEGEVATPPRAPAGTFAVGSHLPQPGTRFYGEIRSPILLTEAPAGEHAYLRFRYLANGLKPGDLIKFMLKKKDGTTFHGFLPPELGSWAIATVRLNGAFRNLDDHGQPLKSGEALNQFVFLGAAPDGAVAVQGPRLWIDDAVVFSAPGDVQVNKLDAE